MLVKKSKNEYFYVIRAEIDRKRQLYSIIPGPCVLLVLVKAVLIFDIPSCPQSLYIFLMKPKEQLLRRNFKFMMKLELSVFKKVRELLVKKSKNKFFYVIKVEKDNFTLLYQYHVYFWFL